MPERSRQYVFASVPYANASPLAHFLPQVCGGAQVVYGHPSSLAQRLVAGEVDVAMLPVAAYFATPGLAMIDGMGICADGAVWSVLLKCRRPLSEIRVVAADPASRSSNALAKLLLKEHFRQSVEMITDAGAEADADVVIGDRALCQPPAPCGDLDLGQCWKDMTALPFVFAVWAYRAEAENAAALAQIASAAKDMGCRNIEVLAAIRAETLHLPLERCREYLASIIRYDLGPREAQGMERFRQLLMRPQEGRP
ncbi:MAG: menaquinone biosynthesis protein [Planctomycetaceae bacterium]|nr:menaquinone biosynthesis protein [Planctomycetaceae bacterium]